MSEQEQGNLETGAMDKAAFGRKVTVLGEREGMGSNSRPGLFVHFVEGAKYGIITADDVGDYYARYAKAVAAKQSIGYIPQASEKVQISKFRQAVALGELVHVNGLEVVNNALRIQREQRAANEGKLPMPPLDGLVAVARAQIAFPDSPLTDDQIDAVMRPKAGDEKTEADLLDAVATQMDKLIERKESPISDLSAEILDTCIKAIMGRVKDLGGTTAQRKAAAKEEAKIAKTKAQLAQLMQDNASRANRRADVIRALTPAPEYTLQAAE
jgi:hypothetical protein